jgi:hypothetical protein
MDRLYTESTKQKAATLVKRGGPELFAVNDR